jgi:hypothetical protein
MFAPPISPKGARAQRAPAPAASCVQEEMTKHAFRFVRSDEDGGYPANIAASGASNITPRRNRRAGRSPHPGPHRRSSTPG